MTLLRIRYSLCPFEFRCARSFSRGRVSGTRWALVTFLEGDLRFSTNFPFVLRDSLPATVVLGLDWFAIFCTVILKRTTAVRVDAG